MIKALSRILKQDKERMNIPKSVQQVIPVKRAWLDDIWLVGNKYSKCWRFTDINYAIASKDDKTSMFLDYFKRKIFKRQADRYLLYTHHWRQGYTRALWCR